MHSRLLRMPLACGLAIAILIPQAAWADKAPEDSAGFYATSIYREQRIEGWRVLVHPDLRGDADLAEPTLTLLRHQLYQITRVVESPVLEKLRRVTIWVERLEPHHPCMAYHPDPGWLREHGMNPDKARCVEVANAKNFLDWSRAQPWMVLHELAHAYHHQFLTQGFQNPEVQAAYRNALSEDRYKSVLHIHGERKRAYALTNPMEYFAETAEAYFGTNDFFPYVRSELKEHDPAGFALHERVWRVAAE